MRLLSTLAAVGVLAVAAFGMAFAAAAAPALVDQRGVPFKLDAHREAVVLTFIATRCTDSCPVANAIFSLASVKASRAHLRATFVTATLDPEYDTPFVMTQYSQRVGADPLHWRFVSGSRVGVFALMRRFGVVSNGREHTSAVYIVQKHEVRTLLLSSDVPDRIVEILKKAKDKNA